MTQSWRRNQQGPPAGTCTRGGRAGAAPAAARASAAAARARATAAASRRATRAPAATSERRTPGIGYTSRTAQLSIAALFHFRLMAKNLNYLKDPPPSRVTRVQVAIND